jgi:hypothetical protein
LTFAESPDSDDVPISIPCHHVRADPNVVESAVACTGCSREVTETEFNIPGDRWLGSLGSSLIRNHRDVKVSWARGASLVLHRDQDVESRKGRLLDDTQPRLPT